MQISVKKVRKDAIVPSYGSAFAAGADLYACIEKSVAIAPGETAFIPTGLAMAIPSGYAGLICARSGLSCKYGLAPANKIGVIDSDYRGEFIIALHNHGKQTQSIAHGDRVAQLLIVPVLSPAFVEVTQLDDTSRGAGGFGSTGR